MSVSLDGKLVVAISSRALFDFEEENELFEQGDDRAYMALQLQRLDMPAKPGVAFSLVKKMLAFNAVGSTSVGHGGLKPAPWVRPVPCGAFRISAAFSLIPRGCCEVMR